MLETQKDVDIDGMERCKGLCKYTFRQDSGIGQVNGCHNFSNAS